MFEAQCKLCNMGVGVLPEGISQRKIAREYGVARSSVQRHIRHAGLEEKGDSPIVTSSEVLDDVVERYGLDKENLKVRGLTIKDDTGSWVRVIHDEDSSQGQAYEHVDPLSILNNLDRSPKEQETGDSAFVVSFNDWQYGKGEGGGVAATIDRVSASVLAAQSRIYELRRMGRSLGTLIIIGGGDIIEGCTIYPNQSYNNELTQSEQIEGALTLLLWCIDQLAPLFDNVVVLATKGNHGENRVDGTKTAARDNNDTMLFRIAQKATERDDTLRHVKYVICEPEEESVYMDVPGTPWRLGTTHGDIFGKFAKGQTKMLKAWDWYKNMAAGRFGIGQCDVLVTHHFHHEEKADWGACLWVQTMAQDGGSAYFEQFSGQYSKPGMLSFVMTPENRYQDEAILR